MRGATGIIYVLEGEKQTGRPGCHRTIGVPTAGEQILCEEEKGQLLRPANL